jgi:Protein of unknown function (DUF3293)
MKRAEQLFRAYRASCYFAGAHAARIGQRAPGLDALLSGWRVQEGVFIAAVNPFSRRMPPGWNARRHTALRERLRGLPYVEGRGGAKRWWEVHCFIGISAARGKPLARLFRQNAMVALRRGGKARLIWLF